MQLDLVHFPVVIEPASAALLNERQKQCLRLVYENLEAKEIAQRLSLSPHTVNEHLRDARRIMGAARSMQAARVLADLERHDRLVSKPIGVVPFGTMGQASPERKDGPSASVAGNRYRLVWYQRIGIVIGLALIVAVLGGALVGTTELVARLLTRYRIDLSDGPHRS